MLRGDLSNEIPPRILVTYDYICDTETVPRKVLGLVVGTTERQTPNREALAELNQVSLNLGALFELVVFDADNDEAREVLSELEASRWQPFNFASGYRDAADLVGDLAYRPEVLGVMDISDRMPMYGSRGVPTDYLARAI